jgi:hypothetical protein
MKKLLYLLLILTPHLFAQVGIGTTDPKGILDINSTDMGLVIPRVTSIEAVTDGNSNEAVNGTIVYDLSRKSTCYRVNGSWICIGKDSNGRPTSQVVTEDYTQVSNYIKASNTDAGDTFHVLAVSGDGLRMAVGASTEDSAATGVNGNEASNSAASSGAVYIFRNDNGIWVQEAYLKASNTDAGDFFGRAVDMDERGIRVFVGAYQEDSSATGINGNQANNSQNNSGAVYVFRRIGTTWSQEAYIKSSNSRGGDNFGYKLSVSDVGNVLAVSAPGEDSNATGIDGDQSDNSASNSGAVYMFERNGTTWTQQSYIKASNTEAQDQFGFYDVAVSGNGTKLAVGAAGERSNATGINGDQNDNSVNGAGAVYVYGYDGTNWYQEAYVKPINSVVGISFGFRLSLSRDGNVLAASGPGDASASTGINGNPANTGAGGSGAVYIYKKQGFNWNFDSYIKSSNSEASDSFGYQLSMDDSGSVLAVSAISEDSMATGINGSQNDNSNTQSGAAYLFKNNGATWEQTMYIKASNTDADDRFGYGVSLSNDGTLLAISAVGEDSNATGVGGDQSNNSAGNSGAVYIIE